MEFKKCNSCNKIFEASNTVCPYCGSSNISSVEQQYIPNQEIKKTKIGGSIFIGILLGLFLGLIGFFISCCTIKSNDGSEKWKTFIGASIGWLCQFGVIISAYYLIAYLH